MGVAAGLLLPAAAARIPDREVEEGGWGPTIFLRILIQIGKNEEINNLNIYLMEISQ